jgi:hypothetical protein
MVCERFLDEPRSDSERVYAWAVTTSYTTAPDSTGVRFQPSLTRSHDGMTRPDMVVVIASAASHSDVLVGGGLGRGSS